ncbi:hypothetical protein BpHYR1_029495 [Brachionus plicatilis]|uniref:Uncharacterized protein n=1 Tax=Brachionus plicatilis TaxID=10195 RepID=A0A3M7RYB9_BRAPC|nr:hypothetical protein BpHYR1_029495 [Brachionus plicatilis]
MVLLDTTFDYETLITEKILIMKPEDWSHGVLNRKNKFFQKQLLDMSCQVLFKLIHKHTFSKFAIHYSASAERCLKKD